MNNTVSVQQAIKFLYLQIIKVDFSNKYCGNRVFPPDINMNFTFATSTLTDNTTGNKLETSFCVKFFMNFTDKQDIIKFSIEANAIFETTIPVTDDFLASDFAKLSAPAISFPFLRAFISNFTLNAGYNPIILPAFNFSQAETVKQID